MDVQVLLADRIPVLALSGRFDASKAAQFDEAVRALDNALPSECSTSPASDTVEHRTAVAGRAGKSAPIQRWRADPGGPDASARESLVWCQKQRSAGLRRVAGILTTVAIVAAYIPARRATAVIRPSPSLKRLFRRSFCQFDVS
jgi:hypothetical protein